MNRTVRVHLRKAIDDSYDIAFVKSLSPAVKDVLRLNLGSSCIVITDSNVRRIYAEQVTRILKQGGARWKLLAVQAGEKSKNRRTKEKIENQLLSFNAGRDSVLIALGGGMIGDLTGFVASTFHRGVPYVQIPTTLLSQVDSSIGGKVAVDHPEGKNLIGAFYQPKKVYIDVSTLQTLPDSEFVNGIAEVIKYACILDRSLFSYLEDNYHSIMKRNSQHLDHIIRRCCELKRDIVEKDEKESGLRRILNFGHTIGHALEHITQYRLSHGKAIAIGIVAEASLAKAMGMLAHNDVERISHLLHTYNLPTAIPPTIDSKRLIEATLHDKKMLNGIVRYTLLERIGKGRIDFGIHHAKVTRMLSL